MNKCERRAISFLLVISTSLLKTAAAQTNTLSEEIAADPAYSFLTDAEKRELDRRLEEGATDPDNSVPWEQIRPEAKARWGR